MHKNFRIISYDHEHVLAYPGPCSFAPVLGIPDTDGAPFEVLFAILQFIHIPVGTLKATQ